MTINEILVHHWILNENNTIKSKI